MTVLIYQTDAYQREFEAEVTAVSPDGAVALDRTCFYPGGGGQPHDLGTLEVRGRSAAVSGVFLSGGRVFHQVDCEPPSIGTPVAGAVAWERRYALMRTHTALHILCGVIWRDYGRLSTGCAMQPASAHIDFDLDVLDAALVETIEESLRTEIAEARPVTVAIRPRAEAEKIPHLVRTKVNLLPRHLTELRIVEIEGLDMQADGGTHVANTSEVGDARIARYKSKGRENKRLYVELSPGDGLRRVEDEGV